MDNEQQPEAAPVITPTTAPAPAKTGTVAQTLPMQYVGNGEYIYGVPARDLSAAEAAQYRTQITATQTATGRVLYTDGRA